MKEEIEWIAKKVTMQDFLNYSYESSPNDKIDDVNYKKYKSLKEHANAIHKEASDNDEYLLLELDASDFRSVSDDVFEFDLKHSIYPIMVADVVMYKGHYLKDRFGGVEECKVCNNSRIKVDLRNNICKECVNSAKRALEDTHLFNEETILHLKEIINGARI